MLKLLLDLYNSFLLIMLLCFSHYELVIMFASSEIPTKVVTEAVRQDSWALRYASEGLRGDRGVVMEAVKQDSGGTTCLILLV